MNRWGFRRPSIEAAGQVALANTTNRLQGWGVGLAALAPAGYDFAPPLNVWSREAAMAVPTVSRARDLLCAVGALPLTLWTVDYSKPEPVETRMPPALWMIRPDPNRTRQWMLAWTVDDLLFTGRAYWRITNRYASTTYPATFDWLPSADVNVGADGKVTFRGEEVKAENLVEFLSPLDGLLFNGWRSISIANNLDAAAERFSTVELPAGWLEQTPDSEPLDADELAEIATDFATARNSRTVAALNPYLRWKESTIDPTRLQLTEARAHQALELSRLCNIPPYLTGAPAGNSMTYQNTAQAKQDLIDFGAMPYINCIEQTLSGPNVTPITQFVRLDLNVWLRNPFTPSDNASPNDAEIALNPSAQTSGDGGPGPGRPRDIDGLNESSTP